MIWGLFDFIYFIYFFSVRCFTILYCLIYTVMRLSCLWRWWVSLVFLYIFGWDLHPQWGLMGDDKLCLRVTICMLCMYALGKLVFSSQRLKLFLGKRGTEKEVMERFYEHLIAKSSFYFKQRLNFLSCIMNTEHISHNYSTYYFLSKHFETAKDSRNIQSRNPVIKGEYMTLVKRANPSVQSSNYFSSTSIPPFLHPEWILFNELSSSPNLN